MIYNLYLKIFKFHSTRCIPDAGSVLLYTSLEIF